YTDVNGNFVIPLTYGINTPGTYRWRVRTWTPGATAFSGEFTLRRLAQPTAWSAGSAPVRTNANVWGTIDGGTGGARVWTEVLINGRWSKSQERLTNVG